MVKKGNISRYEKHSDQAFSRHLGCRDQNNNLLQSPERWPSHWRMIDFNDDYWHNLVQPVPSTILKAYNFRFDLTTLSHMPTVKCIDARRKQVAHLKFSLNRISSAPLVSGRGISNVECAILYHEFPLFQLFFDGK